jgi:hypothetical protein
VERAYSNGAYSHWEPVAYAIARPLPWSLGDFAALAGIAGIVWLIVRFARGRRRRASDLLALVLSIAAVLGIYAIWFEVSWGWNYERPPLEARIRFEPSHVTVKAAVALRRQAMAQLNALAPAAHAESHTLDVAMLRAAWLPVVRRAGDRWIPQTGAPKPTIADPFMMATGTSGFINPLTLNVQLSSDLFWFERPFDLAHEWSHDAAYAREDEANYLGIVTCLRSRDPAMRYAGWFALFLYLPQDRHYARKAFSPLVWRDFAALRRRDARHINVLLAHWTWRTYNVYLKSNRIAAGLENYDEVTRLMLGVPRDAEGLPLLR